MAALLQRAISAVSKDTVLPACCAQVATCGPNLPLGGRAESLVSTPFSDEQSAALKIGDEGSNDLNMLHHVASSTNCARVQVRLHRHTRKVGKGALPTAPPVGNHAQLCTVGGARTSPLSRVQPASARRPHNQGR